MHSLFMYLVLVPIYNMWFGTCRDLFDPILCKPLTAVPLKRYHRSTSKFEPGFNACISQLSDGVQPSICH